ncbi:hypothetical protein H703_01092 [Bartonella bacilliformis Ver075]|nr:hypothetical protein H703_01092 [Bartonella bacilliformis Ver075]
MEPLFFYSFIVIVIYINPFWIINPEGKSNEYNNYIIVFDFKSYI